MKKNIKNTKKVNLLNSNFQMRGNLKNLEKFLIEKWNHYEFKKTKKLFILHDGPPYANGKIHFGHILNKLLKDIIIKFKNIIGFKCEFVFGWDCHGLPIETKVEKIFKNIKDKLKKLKLFKNYVKYYINIQKNEFKKLGIISNYKNYYLTMNNDNISEEIKIINNFLKKNYIYRNYKPLYWCFECESNLSESEVEYKKINDISITILFLYSNIKKILSFFFLKKKYILGGILIWTTAPWTISSSQGLCLNPEGLYVILNTIKGIIITSLQKQSYFKKKNTKYYILSIILGKKMKNIFFLNPVYNLNNFFYKYCKLYMDNYSTTELGTGIFHISPAYGSEDFLIYNKNNKLKNIIDFTLSNGFFKNNIPLFKNIFISRVNELILFFFILKKKYISIEKNNHDYMFCLKHKKKLIYKITSQWFLKFKILKILKKNKFKKINFISQNSKNKFINMLKNKKSWNISRQKIWGTPISFINHKKIFLFHKKIFNFLKIVSNYFSLYGTKFWHIFNIIDVIKNEKLFYKKSYDILDVWFESGNSHWHVLRKTHKNILSFPSDLYLEGVDQHRGWFQSSFITSILLNNKIPFKNIITHGFIVDKYGKKLSKSLNNYFNCEKFIKLIGIDVIKLWICGVNYEKDIKVSKIGIKQATNNYRKIRNIIRFILSNLSDFFKKNELLKINKLLYIDKVFIIYSNYIYKKILFQFDNYDLNKVILILKKFLINDISSIYFEIIKNKMYINSINSRKRKSIQSTLYYILNDFLKTLFPIISFTSEEAWKELYYKKSILEKKYKNYIILSNNNYWNFIKLIKKNFSNFIKLIEKKKINSIELVLFIYCNIKNYKLLKNIKVDLIYLLFVTNIKINLKLNSKKLIFFFKLSKKKKCSRCWLNKINLKNFKNNICKNCFIFLYKQNLNFF